MLNQQKVFADRLARIAAHAGNTNATLHIGMEDQLPRAALVRAAALPKLRNGSLLAALQVPAALIAGGAAFAWGHWARITVLPAADTLTALAGDLVATLVVLLLLRLAFGLTGMVTLLAQVAGAIAGFALLHNAVHLWPDQFAALFPAPWVELVLTTTEPMTLARGVLVF